MKRTVVILLTTIAFCWVTASGKTPAQLVTAFKNILPANQKAQMVWVQYELNKAGARQGCVYGVDSDSGVLRRITTPDSSDAFNPHLTEDGTRVLFYDWNNNGCVRMVNWTGTGMKVIYSGVGSLEDYYQDPTDKSEWAITYNPLARINIATKAFVTLPGYPGDDGVRITPDGKYYASDITGGAKFGYTRISDGQTTVFCTGTCNCNCSPDLTYRLMIQYQGHNSVYVCRLPGIGTGTEYSPQNLTSAIRATYPSTLGCVNQSGDYGFESTRWIAPDYVVMIMTNVAPNPFMVKLSDPTKWLAVNDTGGCNIGQDFMCSAPNARIFDRTTGVISWHEMSMPRVNINLNDVRCESFLPSGRRINPATALSGAKAGSSVRGVVIRRMAGDGVNPSKVTFVQ